MLFLLLLLLLNPKLDLAGLIDRVFHLCSTLLDGDSDVLAGLRLAYDELSRPSRWRFAFKLSNMLAGDEGARVVS